MDVKTGMCSYYMELHKLCLLIDLDSPDLGLASNYRDFRCNYNTYEPGYVMYRRLLWNESDSDHPPEYPTLEHLTFEDTGVEVFLSKEPAV